MANKKISELTPKASQLQDDDLVMVSDYNGATYDTKSVTGANIRPFKTILFNISQSSTAAPTVNYSYVDEVTQTFTFTRDSAGIYKLTASSALFTLDKTFINISLGGAGSGANIGAYRQSTTQILFYTADSTTSIVADSLITLANLEIKIIK
jgi:hypothetical protein